MARLKETSGDVAYPVLSPKANAKPNVAMNDLMLDPKIPQHLATPTKTRWTPRASARRHSKETSAAYAANTARRRIALPKRRLDSTMEADLSSETQRKREEWTDPSVFQGRIKEREERAQNQRRIEEDLHRALYARQTVTTTNVPTASSDHEMIRRMGNSVKTANEALAEATEWFTKIHLEHHSPLEEVVIPRNAADETELGASPKNDLGIMQQGKRAEESTGTEIENEILSPTVTTRRKNKHKKRPAATRKS